MKTETILALAALMNTANPPAVFAQSAAAQTVAELAAPVSDNSAFPQLSEDGKGGVFMTWLETLKDGAGHRLRLAHRKEGGAWSEGVTVQEGKTFWRNWADFPGVGVFADGSVMVHWLARSGEGTYDYNVHARISRDRGKTWGEPFLINTDGKEAEHGFVSFAATEKGLGVVWLDGRETKGMSHDSGEHGAAGAMTLRFAEFLSDGRRVREFVIDSKVCDCCQTAIVNTSKGLLAAYRDRSESELRDITLVRPLAEKVEPREFSKDGWKINACPVNGPALATRGAHVSAAWFTMGGGKPKVRAAVSRDGGETFLPTVDVDVAFPTGRVDIAMLPSGTSLLSWIGRGQGGGVFIKGALLDANGALKPSFNIVPSTIARAGGFPRLELSGQELIVAWTEVGPIVEGSPTPPVSRVRTALIRLN